MQNFSITFKILTLCGFWRPIHFTNRKKKIYNCFTFLMCFLVYIFTLSHLIGIILVSKNFDDLAEKCFLVLSMINVCCKITNILFFRKNILQLLKVLVNDHCVANDKIEHQIEIKFFKKIQYVTLFYTILTETTCMLITLRTLSVSALSILPFKAWIPYNISSQFRYWTIFIHQTIAHIVGASMQVANDTLVCAMLIKISMQLKILTYRFKKITSNFHVSTFNNLNKNINYSKNLFIQCLKHHRCILEYSKKLNDTLTIIIFVQFVISMLVLCSSVYLLSKMKIISLQFMSLMLYLSCMLYQLFLYCWYGNEIILESMDLGNAAYNIDWTVLKIKDKKNLLIIMLLFCKPIKFTSTFFVTLSIDSYCKILKISYSVFNLLQRISM